MEDMTTVNQASYSLSSWKVAPYFRPYQRLDWMGFRDEP